MIIYATFLFVLCTSSVNGGLVSSNTCLQQAVCDLGCTGNSGFCTQCAAGTYKSIYGSASCTSCPLNSYSPAASQLESMCVCNAGFEWYNQGFAQFPCVACQTGYYSQSVGDIQCTRCCSNYDCTQNVAVNNVCVCAAGSYFVSNLGRCYYCEAGTAKASNGNEACTLCAAGTYSNNTVACSACSIGTYSLPGSSVCTACPAGTYAWTEGSTECSAYTCPYKASCDPGCTGNSGLCTQCAAGTYKSSYGSASCTSCPLNSYSPVASYAEDRCFCNPGFEWNHGFVQFPCVACQTGYYLQSVGDMQCTRCCNNYDCTQNVVVNNVCVCAAGSYFVSYIGRCYYCEAGTAKASNGNEACTLCAAGTYSNNAVACSACSTGTYSLPGSSVCTACPAGMYSNQNGSTTCTVCVLGSKPNEMRTACLACPDGSEATGNGMCLTCQRGYYSNVQSQWRCLRCADGLYTLEAGAALCTKCHACPDGYYRSNCSIYTGGGTCSLCDVCPTSYVNVGCMNRAGHTEERGTCRLRKYTSRTPLCDEKKSGYGLGGYTFTRLFGVSQDDSAFQCRRRCDNVQNILSQDVYPAGLRTELLAQFADISVSGKVAPRAFNGGYCGGPYACDVSNCNIAGSADDTQKEYQPMNACPVYMDKKTAEDFWVVAALAETLQTQSSVFQAVQAIRAVKCQTCAQCGQDNTGRLENWGRGCARDCTQLKCTSGLIFDWTEQVEAEKCKTCGELNDVRLCLSSEQRAFDMYDVSGRLPKLYMPDCAPKNDLAVRGYEATYGSCVKCADHVLVCGSQDNMYYQTCASSVAGVVPVCAECSSSNGREPSKSRYWDGETMRNLYCQQKRCSNTGGVAFTGVDRESTRHGVCQRKCTNKVCDGDSPQVLLPCVLPHEARCMHAINMDALVKDTSYGARQYAPAHVNMLEPATDALHLFSSFENTLVDTQAYQNDLRAQCVWNADFILDNNMNPGGVSSTFQKACRTWLRDPRAQYPLMPLQNTVTVDEVDDSVFPRRALLNTSAQAVTYTSDDVQRPANVFAGDIYLQLNLTNTNNATFAVFVPGDRNITTATWVPRWRVSVHAQQIAGDTTSMLLRTPDDGMCLSCFSLRRYV